ncbi:TPA: hypothetical protein NPN63_005347 [Klebsiella pneumoniae]|nr:hypothetical protein [Klebsiella pneumoniae]
MISSFATNVKNLAAQHEDNHTTDMVNPVQGWHLNITEATVWESDGEKNGYSGNSTTPMVKRSSSSEYYYPTNLTGDLEGRKLIPA